MSSNNSLVLSYLDLRKAIGIIGIALPFVLVFGKMLLDSPGIQASISAYYYTIMRDVFVGSLCAIGVFLMSYRGYERTDRIAGKAAFIFALGTALLPTRPEMATAKQIIISHLHITSAMLLFFTLAFFALFLFRKTAPGSAMTAQKRRRNMVYTACGILILLCIVLAFFAQLLPADSPIRAWSPIFWLESIAILAFGVSWFVKGEAILKDGETGIL